MVLYVNLVRVGAWAENENEWSDSDGVIETGFQIEGRRLDEAITQELYNTEYVMCGRPLIVRVNAIWIMTSCSEPEWWNLVWPAPSCLSWDISVYRVVPKVSRSQMEKEIGLGAGHYIHT